MRIKNFYRIITINIVTLLTFSSLINAGTTGKVVGTVIDQTTGEPLPGVNIMFEGTTSQGTVSDIDGHYSILNVRPGTYSIIFKFIGYTN